MNVRLGRKIIEQAVYLVVVKVRPMNPGDPNTEVAVAKLRRADADRVALQIPGSWVVKVVATKP